MKLIDPGLRPSSGLRRAGSGDRLGGGAAGAARPRNDRVVPDLSAGVDPLDCLVRPPLVVWRYADPQDGYAWRSRRPSRRSRETSGGSRTLRPRAGASSHGGCGRTLRSCSADLGVLSDLKHEDQDFCIRATRDLELLLQGSRGSTTEFAAAAPSGRDTGTPAPSPHRLAPNGHVFVRRSYPWIARWNDTIQPLNLPARHQSVAARLFRLRSGGITSPVVFAHAQSDRSANSQSTRVRRPYAARGLGGTAFRYQLTAAGLLSSPSWRESASSCS